MKFKRSTIQIQDFCKGGARDFVDITPGESRQRGKFGPKIGGRGGGTLSWIRSCGIVLRNLQTEM